MNDNSDLQLTPETEEIIQIAVELPYHPGLVLIPVACDVCKLLMYAGEEQVGQWKICPDCGRKTLIRPVKPIEKVVVEFSPDGGYQIRKTAVTQSPAPRVVSDYRDIEGSVDYRACRMPNRVVPEQNVDPLEAAMDQVLSGKKDPTSPKQPPVTPSVYSLHDTTAQDSIQKSTPVQQVDAAHIGRKTVPVPPIAQRSGSTTTRTGKTPSERGTPTQTGNQSTIPAATKGASLLTLKSFFYPFFDKCNSWRFLYDFIVGMIAIYLSLNLFRFLAQFVFSIKYFAAADSLGLKEIVQFLGEYMLGMLPFGIWFVFLAINAMTIFVQTKNGDDRVQTWALFRTDFAIQYFIWIALLGCIALIPGQLISAGLFLQGCPAWRLLFIPASLYLLFPLFFLSVTQADTGLELFQKRIWKSVLFQPLHWLVYYLLALPLCLGFVGASVASYLLVACFLEVNYFVIQLLFLPVAPLLCQVFRWSIYLYFRLLGTLAWNLND
ncbi:MAG: hypothetical protein PHQ75_07730 [Thermoguttaceae bacterium]|nr:hypothetical protein [Thermoguttaceae bacterium]